MLLQGTGAVCFVIAILTLKTTIFPIVFGILGLWLLFYGSRKTSWYRCAVCGGKLLELRYESSYLFLLLRHRYLQLLNFAVEHGLGLCAFGNNLAPALRSVGGVVRIDGGGERAQSSIGIDQHVAPRL